MLKVEDDIRRGRFSFVEISIGKVNGEIYQKIKVIISAWKFIVESDSRHVWVE